MAKVVENQKQRGGQNSRRKWKIGLGAAGALITSLVVPNPMHRMAFGPTDDEIANSILARQGISRPGGNMIPERESIPVSVSSVRDPQYKQAELIGDIERVTVDGTIYEVRAVKDRYPVFQTEDGKKEFYISNMDAARTSGGISSSYNVSSGIDHSTRLELKDGTFIIPSPQGDISQVLRSGYLEKMGLEFNGIVGTGYVLGNKPHGVERRVGYAWLRDYGVAFDNLDAEGKKLRRGFYVENDGKMRILELPATGYRERLERLTRNPNVLAVAIHHHGEGQEATFDGKRYRAPYLVFNKHGGFSGALFTSEAQGDEARNAQIDRAFPDFGYAWKLDGDFYSKWWILGFPGGADIAHYSELAVNFENPMLIVKKRPQDGTAQPYDNAAKIVGEMHASGSGIMEAARVANVYHDVRDPSKVEQKLRDKLPPALSWMSPGLAWWGVRNPYFRGYMLRQSGAVPLSKQ